MRLEVRLYASLAPFAPTHRAGEPFDVEVSEPTTLDTLLTRLGVPAGDVHLIIVNGRIVHDRSRLLAGHDRVGLFPPVGGG